MGKGLGAHNPLFVPKEKNESFIVRAMKTSKPLPGVGRYDIANMKGGGQLKKKIIGSYTLKETGGGYIDTAIARGQQSPGHKDPVHIEKIRRRSPKPLIFKVREETPLVKDMKVAKAKGPAPTTYEKISAFERTVDARPSYSFEKSIRQSGLEKKLVKEKKWPGAAHYDVKKADRIMTLGFSRGWK